MSEKVFGNCICCGKPGKQSIIIAVGPDRNGGERYYIPNHGVREHMKTGGNFDVSREVSFCAECMRQIEDNFRATIQYLRTESGLFEARAVKPS